MSVHRHQGFGAALTPDNRFWTSSVGALVHLAQDRTIASYGQINVQRTICVCIGLAQQRAKGEVEDEEEDEDFKEEADEDVDEAVDSEEEEEAEEEEEVHRHPAHLLLICIVSRKILHNHSPAPNLEELHGVQYRICMHLPYDAKTCPT